MKSKTYKFAFIDQKGNIGGGIKYAKQLLSNFNKFYKNVRIDYYASPNSIKFFQTERLNLENITIKELSSLKLNEKGIFSLKNSGKILKQVQEKFLIKNKYLNHYFSGNLNLELEKKIKNYDFAFFLWPYLIDMPNIKVKKLIVLHDFMFKYYFGGSGSFNSKEIELQNLYLNKWVKSSEIILTSNYMKNEFLKFYPKTKKKHTHIIPVAPLTQFKTMNTNSNIKKFKIKSKFILCPTVDKPHKNIFNLIKAFNLVKKKFKNLSLVFCGAGTNLINGNFISNGVQISKNPRDIYGLGYVSDDELKKLIMNAELTINPSIYDAGNGSGLDAWQLGSPVLMSNIPPFKEQLKFHKVDAITFDPHNYFDISKKIISLLKLSKSKKKYMVEISKKNLRKYNWKSVVDKYYKLINNLE